MEIGEIARMQSFEFQVSSFVLNLGRFDGKWKVEN